MRPRFLVLPVSILAITIPCSAAAATQPSRDTVAMARSAVGQSPAAVKTLIDKAKGNPALARAILSYSKTEIEISPDGRRPSSPALPVQETASAIRPGCHGTFSDRHTIKFPAAHLGVTIAWQQVTVHGFCWNGKRITWWGGATVRRWSAFAYCWNNTSQGDTWNSYPKWREAFAYGVLGGNSGFGCINLQADQPIAYYANGGGIFRR